MGKRLNEILGGKQLTTWKKTRLRSLSHKNQLQMDSRMEQEKKNCTNVSKKTRKTLQHWDRECLKQDKGKDGYI